MANRFKNNFVISRKRKNIPNQNTCDNMEGGKKKFKWPPLEEVKIYMDSQYYLDQKGNKYYYRKFTKEMYQYIKKDFRHFIQKKVLFRSMWIEDFDGFLFNLQRLHHICCKNNQEEMTVVDGVGVHWTSSSYVAHRFGEGCYQIILIAKVNPLHFDSYATIDRARFFLSEPEDEVQLFEKTKVRLLKVLKRDKIGNFVEIPLNLTVYT